MHKTNKDDNFSLSDGNVVHMWKRGGVIKLIIRKCSIQRGDSKNNFVVEL